MKEKFIVTKIKLLYAGIKHYMFLILSRPIMAATVTLVLILVSLSLYLFLPQSPVVHDIKGIVKIYDANKNIWAFAKDNQKVGVHNIIKTFDDGSVDISLKGIYSMRLRKGSEVLITRLNSRFGQRKINFYLEKGKVLAYYAGGKTKKKRNFSVETNELIASALGTDFMVRSLPKVEKSWVGVLEGIVKVTSKEVLQGLSEEATVYVESSYKTEVEKGRKPLKPVRMVKDEWLDLTELYAIGTKPQIALLISSGSSRTRELLSMATIYVSDEKPSVLPGILRDTVEIFNQAVLEGSLDKHKETIKRFESIVRKHPNPKYDVQFLLFIAAYYFNIGKYDEALQTFQEIIDRYPKARLTSIAQCAIGIINEEATKNYTLAAQAYRDILTNYPSSPEAKEALAGLFRIESSERRQAADTGQADAASVDSVKDALALEVSVSETGAVSINRVFDEKSLRNILRIATFMTNVNVITGLVAVQYDSHQLGIRIEEGVLLKSGEGEAVGEEGFINR